jgi:hypothetical protein
MTAAILLRLSLAARCQGDAQWAAQLGDEGLALARELGESSILDWALHERGQSALACEDIKYAARLFAEGLGVSQESGRAHIVPAFLAGLAAVEVDPVRAVRLFGAAQALLDARGGAHDRPDRAAYDRALDAARAALDEQAFARAWAEGRAMASQGHEPAVAYALEHKV